MTEVMLLQLPVRPDKGVMRLTGIELNGECWIAKDPMYEHIALSGDEIVIKLNHEGVICVYRRTRQP